MVVALLCDTPPPPPAPPPHLWVHFTGRKFTVTHNLNGHVFTLLLEDIKT